MRQNKKPNGTLTTQQGLLVPTQKWIWDSGPHDKLSVRITQIKSSTPESGNGELEADKTLLRDTHWAGPHFLTQPWSQPPHPKEALLSVSGCSSRIKAHALKHSLKQKHRLPRVNTSLLVLKNLNNKRAIGYQNLSFPESAKSRLMRVSQQLHSPSETPEVRDIFNRLLLFPAGWPRCFW